MYCECIITIPTESTVALPNSFTPGAFPEYRLDCTQLSNGTWHCSPVEQQCDSFLELGVVCKNYEDIYNEYLKNCTPSKFPVTTTQSSTTQQSKLINVIDNKQYILQHDTIIIIVTTQREAVCANHSTVTVTTLTAGIGVLVALLLAVSVGWIVSCVILLRRGQTVHKQQ